MTLGRLVLAWLPVALWFAGLGWITHRWIGVAASPAPSRTTLAWTAGEALIATLVASLWFDSLGHGGWWVLFGLLGLLASGLSSRPPLIALAFAVARYVAAGALLAWRLG
jgi:hypothetical protein